MFALARVVPGDPCRAVLGERATDAVCDAFITRYGLDKAIIPGLFKANHAVAFHIEQIPTTLLDNQFVAYLGQLAQGDLGTSIKHSRPVTELLIERLPTTIELTIMAMLFAVSVGIPLGLISGYRHNSKADVGTMVVANFGRVDPGLRAGPRAGLPLRPRPERHAVRAATLGPAQHGRRDGPARHRLGPRGPAGPATRHPRLPLGPVHPGRHHQRPVQRLDRRLPPPDPAGDRAGHDPARDHRPDHPLEPARGRSARTSSGRRGRRA